MERLSAIHGPPGDNRASVILIVRTVDCDKYFTEIQWWMNELKSEPIVLSIIIAERYERYFEITADNFGLESIAYPASFVGTEGDR